MIKQAKKISVFSSLWEKKKCTDSDSFQRCSYPNVKKKLRIVLAFLILVVQCIVDFFPVDHDTCSSGCLKVVSSNLIRIFTLPFGHGDP